MGQTKQQGYQIRAMVGATAGTAGQSGVVPAPVAGDQAKALLGSGLYGDISGGGAFSVEVTQFSPDDTLPAEDRAISGIFKAIAFWGSVDSITYAQFTTDDNLDDTKDIKFEVMYSMSSSETSKKVSLNADIYVFSDNEDPAKAADVSGQEDEITVPNDGNTDKLVLTNIKVPLADLSGVGQVVVVKLYRDVDGVTPNHSGDFQMISLRAYQV